jgi:hypothetical protein
MSEQNLKASSSSDAVPPGGTPGDSRRELSGAAVPSAQNVAEQLAREYADIERATLALRKAPPTPDSRRNPPRRLIAKPRSLWLLIGVLWLSTALVTAGAVVVVASFAG